MEERALELLERHEKIRREVASRIAAGIAANPADAYVTADMAAIKAVEFADALLAELGQTRK